MNTATADNQPQGGPTMTELIEAIRAAVADGATPEQKAIGAQACRTILAALDEEARLIRRLRPRDNLIGQPELEEAPF